MSGYRHSGLTREDYEDREVLRAALEVIKRRWPFRVATAELLADLVGRHTGEGDE